MLDDEVTWKDWLSVIWEGLKTLFYFVLVLVILYLSAYMVGYTIGVIVDGYRQALGH